MEDIKLLTSNNLNTKHITNTICNRIGIVHIPQEHFNTKVNSCQATFLTGKKWRAKKSFYVNP